MHKNLSTALSLVQKEALNIFINNNNDQYYNTLEREGLNGVVESIKLCHITTVNNENLRETLLNLHNYAGLAVVMMDHEANMSKNAGIELTSVMNAVSLNNNDCDINLLEYALDTRLFESHSSPGQYHTTKRLRDGFKCSCLGYEYRNWCSHCEKMNEASITSNNQDMSQSSSN